LAFRTPLILTETSAVAEESFAPKTEELVEVWYEGNDPGTFIVDEIGLVEEDTDEK